jgi:hypothetical protein
MAVWVLVALLCAAAGLGAYYPLGICFLAGLLGLGGLLLRRERLAREDRPAVPVAHPLVIVAGIVAVAAFYRLVRYAGVPLASFDVLSYHLPIASAFLDGSAAQRILFAPVTFYERLPLGGSILEVPFISTMNGGPDGPGIQALLIAALLGAANSAFRCARWLGAGPTASAFAPALMLLLPLASDTVLKGLMEPLLVVLAVAAFELILQSGGRAIRRTEAALAGLLLGTCFAIKLSAVGVVIIPLVAYMLWLSGWRRKVRLHGRTLIATGWLLLGILLAAGPWLLRSILVAGHPLHPFGGFSEAWTAEQARFVVEVHEPLSPFSANYLSNFLLKMRTLGFSYFGVPILIVFTLLATVRRRGTRIRIPLLVVMAGYCSWLLVQDNPARFLFPAVALLVPIAVAAADALLPRFGALILLAVILPSTRTDFRDAFSFDTYYAPSYRAEALAGYVGQDFLQLTRVTEPFFREGTMLLFFESRPALFDGATESRSVWDQPSYGADLREAVDDEDFAARLRARGIRSIFVNEIEWGRYLQFYARDQFPNGMKLMGGVGLSMTDRAMKERALAAFPPHRFAGFQAEELRILSEFLRKLRLTTRLAIRSGEAEAWIADIPPVTEEETTP